MLEKFFVFFIHNIRVYNANLSTHNLTNFVTTNSIIYQLKTQKNKTKQVISKKF